MLSLVPGREPGRCGVNSCFRAHARSGPIANLTSMLILSSSLKAPGSLNCLHDGSLCPGKWNGSTTMVVDLASRRCKAFTFFASNRTLLKTYFDR